MNENEKKKKRKRNYHVEFYKVNLNPRKQSKFNFSAAGKATNNFFSNKE